MKCLIFYGMFSFQIVFHRLLPATPFEHSAEPDCFFSPSTRVYALFTVNFLLLFLAYSNLSLKLVKLSGILKIASVSSGRNYCLSLSTSYSLDALFISSQTKASFEVCITGEITLKVLGLGIHLSHHTLILCLVPTCHLEPRLIIP